MIIILTEFYILVKCAKQPDGTNLYGYYVCDFIRERTVEKGKVLEQFYVRKLYSQFSFITINCVELHSYILNPFFKLGRTEAGHSPTTVSPASNLRGIGGILKKRGPISHWRILSLPKQEEKRCQ